MSRPHLFRHEDLHRLTHEFASVVAEEFFGLGVDQRHLPGKIDHHARQGCSLDGQADEFVRTKSLRDIGERDHHAVDAVVVGAVGDDSPEVPATGEQARG